MRKSAITHSSLFFIKKGSYAEGIRQKGFIRRSFLSEPVWRPKSNGTHVAPYTRSAPGGGALPDYSSPSYSSSSYSSPTYEQQSSINSLPKSKAMSSGGENLISTVEVNINGKSFGKVGIMVGG